MPVYVIGDLHLSLGGNKPMDIFDGWDGYKEKIEHNWKNKINDDDTTILAGDISWGMSLEESLVDFLFIENLPGKKIILKGNHDYWWNTMGKMKAFFAKNGISSISILHNNSYEIQGINICGSRGWLFETGQSKDEKIINREVQRMDLSIQSVKNKELPIVLFLHYPPLIKNHATDEFINIMLRNRIKYCYYGHIHGAGHKMAFEGLYKGINFKLISADFVKFDPQIVTV